MQERLKLGLEKILRIFFCGLATHLDVFCTDKHDLGRRTDFEHKIDLKIHDPT